MASILRQIVASPRARHAEAGLDLCYVTDDIIATSGPSQTYPQRAYRNPLDQLVAFLDAKHGDDWAIWEFRAEGTGYPDDAVYGRVRHYPWPDHHPPPFRLVPHIMASMRNWLHGGALDGGVHEDPSAADKVAHLPAGTDAPPPADKDAPPPADKDAPPPVDKHPPADPIPGRRRVVVVHCKAGKGRSGTATCSYLISEQGWKAQDALARFTERRMRPRFGAGVSIPSQLRWIGYVDRWTQNGKRYVDRAVEVLEVHVWGLRNGVKVDVEGFVDNGRKISVFHTFSNKERHVVEGDAPAGGGIGSVVWEWAGYPSSAAEKTPETAGPDDAPGDKKHQSLKHKGTDLIQKASSQRPRHALDKLKSKTAVEPGSAASPDARNTSSDESEPGGMAVILKPSEPIRIPTSDINISVERRNKTPKSMGLTMVTAVAHVWFNAFFEGQGPEQQGRPNQSGVFAIDWDAMDGIKGSSRKGARALDRLAVVWRTVGDDAVPGEEIIEPPEGQPVPQLQAADWAGATADEPDLGLRVQSPTSADVSRASSLRSTGGASAQPRTDAPDDEGASLQGVRSSGPAGEELDGTAKAT